MGCSPISEGIGYKRYILLMLKAIAKNVKSFETLAQLKVKHNKDYSVVKTFKVGVWH